MSNRSSNQNETDYLELIHNLIKEMKYGTVSIVIQDGKIVQVEKNEKYRI